MANLLIFDADYVSELTSRMNTACELMAQAVTSLKGAQNHENWKCKERTRILEDFDELNLKLGRLDTGVNETTRILGGSVSRFAALEQQYESQAEGLSDELTSNYGFRASVNHGGSSGASGGGVSGGTGTGTSGTTPSGQEGAGGEGGTGSGAGGHSGGHGSGAGIAAGMAGRIPGAGRQNHEGRSNHEGTGTGGGTGSTMNVNLPVTHIPDNPDAAARGTKDTREIAQIAVQSVAMTMTEILSGGTRTSSSSRSEINFTATAPTLAEAYNAGRSIFENSAAIMASPTQPHTTERLAMAAGLVSLAGSTAAGLAMMGQAAGGIAASGFSGAAGAGLNGAGSSSVFSGASVNGAGATASASASVSSSSTTTTSTTTSSTSTTSSFTASSSFSQNAGSLMQVLQGNSDAGEFTNLLGMLTGNTSGTSSSTLSAAVSGAGSSDGSFSNLLVNYIRQNLAGGSSSSGSSSLQSMFSASSVSSSSTSSATASSPVMDFLGTFVMDQAV